MTAPQFAHHLNRPLLGDGARIALNAARHSAGANTAPEGFLEALATTLTTGPHALPLINLVELVTEARKANPNTLTDEAMGAHFAVGHTVQAIVHDTAPESMPTAERARKLLAIRGINRGGLTPHEARGEGANAKTIAVAEIAQFATWKLEDLLFKVHGDDWHTMQDEQADEASRNHEPLDGPTYTRWLTAQVNAL